MSILSVVALSPEGIKVSLGKVQVSETEGLPVLVLTAMVRGEEQFRLIVSDPALPRLRQAIEKFERYRDEPPPDAEFSPGGSTRVGDLPPTQHAGGTDPDCESNTRENRLVDDQTNPDICRCGLWSEGRCKCPLGDRRCRSGHAWHFCVVHGTRVAGEADHSRPTDECRCLHIGSRRDE